MSPKAILINSADVPGISSLNYCLLIVINQDNNTDENPNLDALDKTSFQQREELAKKLNFNYQGVDFGNGKFELNNGLFDYNEDLNKISEKTGLTLTKINKEVSILMEEVLFYLNYSNSDNNFFGKKRNKPNIIYGPGLSDKHDGATLIHNIEQIKDPNRVVALDNPETYGNPPKEKNGTKITKMIPTKWMVQSQIEDTFYKSEFIWSSNYFPANSKQIDGKKFDTYSEKNRDKNYYYAALYTQENPMENLLSNEYKIYKYNWNTYDVDVEEYKGPVPPLPGNNTGNCNENILNKIISIENRLNNLAPWEYRRCINIKLSNELRDLKKQCESSTTPPDY